MKRIRKGGRHRSLITGSAAIIALVAATAALMLGGCDVWVATEPPYYEVMELSGSPYERGFAHGVRFESKIQSLYTMLLTNSIFPYLNRERDDVASVMIRYQDDNIYGDGKFAPTMMLESAYALLPYIPEHYVQEMHGVADGSGMSFDDILVMNTFFDTLMAFRSLTFYIKLIQGPVLLSVEVVGAESDGEDNDGDGEVDEKNEGLMSPYEPRSYGSFREIPADAKFRFIIDDLLNGVDMDSIRIQLNHTQYTSADSCIKVEPYDRDGKTVQVTFTPPDGLDPAAPSYMLVQSVDLNETTRNKPWHPRSMRDERIAISTAGYGRALNEITNRGLPDGRSQPPSLGFAVTGNATADGSTYLGHNFAMLDSDITHKHATLFVQHNEEGKSFAYLGYTGLIWGFSGMNNHGVSYLYNTSDTLNNSFTQGFTEGLVFAKLQPKGLPIGLMGREILEKASTSEKGLNAVREHMPTFGWNILIADAAGDSIALEMDGNLNDKPEGSYYYYSTDPEDPGNLDQWGNLYASVRDYDLRMSSHYQKDLEEIRFDLLVFKIQPQRYWSSFYFRSVKAFHVLGEHIEANYGDFDLSKMASVLRTDELEDLRDSMNSAIYEPNLLRLHIAAGEVPAGDAPYRMYDLNEFHLRFEDAQ